MSVEAKVCNVQRKHRLQIGCLQISHVASLLSFFGPYHEAMLDVEAAGAPQCEASKKACNFEKQTPSLPFLFLGFLQSRLRFVLELRELKKKHKRA